jgi:hypothetical protein
MQALHCTGTLGEYETEDLLQLSLIGTLTIDLTSAVTIACDSAGFTRHTSPDPTSSSLTRSTPRAFNSRFASAVDRTRHFPQHTPMK